MIKVNTTSRESVMTLRLMRIFRSVAEHKSFSRASEELEITRPAVSQAITQLEEHLQVQLFNRTTRRVDLTPEGQLYYHHVIDILERMELMKEQLKVPLDGPSGRVRIDVTPEIAKTFLLPQIMGFQEKYPNIEIVLGSTSSNVNFAESSIDFAFKVGEYNQQDTDSLYIGTIDYVCCASPSYIKKNGAPKNLDDLVDHTAVNYYTPATGRTWAWPFKDQDSVRHVDMAHNLAVDDPETCLVYAAAGKGIAVLAQFLAQPKIDDGSLLTILEEHPIESQPLHLVFAQSKNHSQKVQLFCDWMENLGNGFTTESQIQ